MSSCGRTVASPPRRRGCQVREPLRHGGHRVVVVVGPVAPPGRASGRGDAGVYTDRRKRPLGAVSGHLCTLLRRELRRVARAPQPPWRAGSAPSVARLSLGRENRLCASGAAARLAFSPGRQPTQTPEEPAFCTVSFLPLRGFTLLSVRELRKDDRDGTTAGTTGIASGFLTRINEGHSPKEAPL